MSEPVSALTAVVPKGPNLVQRTNRRVARVLVSFCDWLISDDNYFGAPNAVVLMILPVWLLPFLLVETVYWLNSDRVRRFLFGADPE